MGAVVRQVIRMERAGLSGKVEGFAHHGWQVGWAEILRRHKSANTRNCFLGDIGAQNMHH